MNRPASTFQLLIDETRCQACPKCSAKKHCRGRAIIQIEVDAPPYLDMSQCQGCLVCIPACPFGAVVLRPANQ